MKCAYHPEVNAVGACTNCGRLICAECEIILNGKLFCKPCTGKLQGKKREKLGLFKKARTGTGYFVQIIGGIFWIGSGLAVFIWTLYVLFDTFGAWTILIALLLAPITYLAAIFIVWFSTGVFPIIVLILWLFSWVGVAIAYVGSRISGED